MPETVVADRDHPAHVLPDGVPEAMAAFDESVDMLGASKPGKIGLLELGFEVIEGSTRISHHYQRTPLQIYRPLYIDPILPQMAFIYLIQAGGGMLQGDRYRMDVACGEGTAVHLTTQASTRIYRAEQNFVSHVINIHAGPDAVVEYLPDTTIPFRGSRFYQRMNVTTDPTASVIFGEILLPGRVAYGERHSYDVYLSDSEVSSGNGSVMFRDTILLDPMNERLNGLARLGPYDVLGTLFVATQKVPATTLNNVVRETLADFPEIAGGSSELPNESGVSIRLLGFTSAEVQEARHAVWSNVRRTLLGAPAPDLRKA